MIRSMTGYGKASAELPGKKITVEIRSLNSKLLDINSKMPWIYREREVEIRNIINRKLDRGKIDISLNVDVLDDQNVPAINKSAVRNYYNQLTDVVGELNIESQEQLLSIIMRLPETLRNEKEELSEEEWKHINSLINEALELTDHYRLEEGKAMEIDLRERISNITSLLKSLEPLEEGRINSVRERIGASLENLGPENIDNNRFEQEILFYLEKLDINEEKVRLRKHCDYFIEVIESEDNTGKKLGFIAQEIGREINTLGSKSNDAAIQRIVVMMKDELEKVKEQLLNIL